MGLGLHLAYLLLLCPVALPPTLPWQSELLARPSAKGESLFVGSTENQMDFNHKSKSENLTQQQ